MPFRPPFAPSAALLSVLASLTVGISHAEDPFLGQIREIKCVNCRPGWVTLVVHDPIEIRDFELYLKDSDYNKIITPLPGKRIHDRDGQCFYWMEKPKKMGSGPSVEPGGKAPPSQGAVGPGAAKGPAMKPGTARAPSGTDSVLESTRLAGLGGETDGMTAVDPPPSMAGEGTDSAPAVPPSEVQGTPSTCIRFFREMK